MKKLPLIGAFLFLGLGLSACGAPGSGFDNPFAVPLVMTFSPGTVTVAQGQTSHVAVNVSTSNKVNVAATLSASSSAGVTVTPDSAGLSIAGASETSPGTYGIPGTAKSGNGTATGVLNVTVVTPEAPQ